VFKSDLKGVDEMENSEDVQALIRELTPVCQALELTALTARVTLLRLLGTTDKVCEYLTTEVDQTLLHRQCQEKFTDIQRIYEIERQHRDPEVRAQAAPNVINAIQRALEPVTA
jgi:hypothetical protein